jgi:hypothetical protein
MKSMQYFVLFLFVNIFCISQGYCEELENEKIYLQPDQIHIESDGIFVKLSDQWVKVESINLDANGLHVKGPSSEAASFSWICPIPKITQKLADRRVQSAKNRSSQRGVCRGNTTPFAMIDFWQLSIPPIGQFLSDLGYKCSYKNSWYSSHCKICGY